jgi:hypothetical protein
MGNIKMNLGGRSQFESECMDWKILLILVLDFWKCELCWTGEASKVHWQGYVLTLLNKMCAQ